MKFVIAFSLALALAACSSTAKFDSAVAQGRCEDAAQSIPAQTHPGLKLMSASQQVGGTLLSYSLTGAAYTVEVLWDAVGGTTMFVALCGPGVVGGVIAKNASNTNTPCFPGKLNALGAPPLGRRAYASTRDLRCPALDPLARSLREVATCYQKRGADADREKARQSLAALHNSGEFYACLDPKEQRAIEDLDASLK